MILLLVASERALENLNLVVAMIAEKWRLFFTQFPEYRNPAERSPSHSLGKCTSNFNNFGFENQTQVLFE